MFGWLEKRIFQKNLDTNHILIGEIKNTNKSNRIVLMLLKAALIFIAAYCSVVGLLDTFQIPFNRLALIIAFIIASLYFGLVYVHKIIFYSGYILFSFFYLIYIVRYYVEANSGFQAALNIIYEKYSDYFKLSSLRQGQETIENRYYTVTVAGIFLGIFLIMLLNITISGYMNVLETILITFPFIEIALFINEIPSIIYLVGLCFVYICVAILQFSRHSRLQVKSKRTHEFTRLSRGKKFYYFYQADTRIFITTFIISILISIVLCLSLYSVSSKETSQIAKNRIHKQTNEYVKVFIQSGWTAFLDSYSSKGGLSSGKLGGVSQVRPDFETDLTVTYAPNNYETIYLKSYTGNYYIHNIWLEDFGTIDENTNENLSLFMDDIDKLENTRIIPFENNAKMIIYNNDSPSNNIFRPYFSNPDEAKCDVSDSFPANATAEITYHPMTTRSDFDNVYEDNLLLNDEYSTYVNDLSLITPDYLDETLDDVINEIGLTKKESYTNEERLDYARAIYSYYYDNFSYTMAPGSTPKNKDFVEYFLTEQKRGFCAHFATSEVLLLRKLGIPARYCEGYAITLSTVDSNGSLTEEKYEDFYTGSSIVPENTVIQVEVSDANAHAWIEIYLDGYGFVPFEATIPSFDDNEVNNSLFSFAGLFSGLINNANISESTDNNNANANLSEAFNIFPSISAYTGPVSIIVIIFFAILITGVAIYYLTKFIVLRIKLMIYRKNNDEYNLVIYEYNKLIKKLRRKKYLTKENPLPMDVKEAYDLYIISYNNKHKKSININTEELFEYYERIMYS